MHLQSFCALPLQSLEKMLWSLGKNLFRAAGFFRFETNTVRKRLQGYHDRHWTCTLWFSVFSALAQNLAEPMGCTTERSKTEWRWWMKSSLTHYHQKQNHYRVLPMIVQWKRAVLAAASERKQGHALSTAMIENRRWCSLHGVQKKLENYCRVFGTHLQICKILLHGRKR